MGTSVLLAPFILPFAFYVIIKMMLNPSDFIGFLDVFFTEEAFKAYEEAFKYFTNGEFAETLIKNLSENFSGYYF